MTVAPLPFLSIMASPGHHRLTQVLLLVLLALHHLTVGHQQQKGQDKDGLVKLQEEQLKRLLESRFKCAMTLANLTKPTDGIYCDALFDNILCWLFTPAGTLAKQPCPDFIENFDTAEFAVRICREDGTWGPPPADANRTNDTTMQAPGWTNFQACEKQPSIPAMPPYVPTIIKEHMPVITLISKVGYSISLVSLVIATAIMVRIKRLHCQRNVIHINLFVTFMLRAVICLLRDSLLVQGLGLPQDVQYDENGSIEFNPHGPHWECKLLFTLFYWSLCSNYMWIFVEGLYLHTLIFFAVFDQKAIFKWYIIIGWVTPFFFVIPWVLVRIFLNDTLCWNTHENGYYWILNGPIVISICMNFFFFLNIIRVLYTKLRASTTDESQRYRKLAKSTLVLIPLFGVYYVFFIIITNQNHSHAGLEVGLFYAEMTLNSFQGTVVAILFCFTNGEVRSELKKRWQRHMLRRQSVASMRSSRAMSTTSFFLRERTSISHGLFGNRRGSKFPNVESSVSLRAMDANGSAGGKGTSKIPKPGSSPCLGSTETNGGVERIELQIPNSSPSRLSVGSGTRGSRFLASGSNVSLGSMDSNSMTNSEAVANNQTVKGNPSIESCVYQLKSGKIPGQSSPCCSVKNGKGASNGNLSSMLVESEEDAGTTDALEFTPMLGDSTCHL